MRPTITEEQRILMHINDGIAINTLRQDVVYDLFRRGLLALDADNRLHISEAGKAACAGFQCGDAGP